MSKQISKECPQCGQTFSRSPSQMTICCSRKCNVEFRTKPPIVKTCPQCKKEFGRCPSHVSICCSKECSKLYNRQPYTDRTCKQCGKGFQIESYKLNNKNCTYTGDFCSKQCYFESKKKMQIDCICQYCNKHFFVNRTRTQKYCSTKCAGLASRCEMEERKCQQCGVQLINRHHIKFCSEKCYGLSRRTPLIERFEKNLGQPDENGCIPWFGTRNHKGYGVISDKTQDKKLVSAHRLSYELNNGPIPKGLLVCHKCDNPWCVNPDHLFLGTTDDNMADMVQKERQVRGNRVNTAKLTDDDVRTIRNRYKNGESAKLIAIEYKIHATTIFHIVAKTTWKHIK